MKKCKYYFLFIILLIFISFFSDKSTRSINGIIINTDNNNISIMTEGIIYCNGYFIYTSFDFNVNDEDILKEASLHSKNKEEVKVYYNCYSYSSDSCFIYKIEEIK